MKFRATIRKKGSLDEERVVEAPSRFVVYEDVQREGGLVVRIQEARTKFALPAWTSITIGSGVKRSQVIRVASNLSAMISAGLTLSRALSIIERQSSNKRLGRIAAGLSDSIRKGSSFHEALSAYPRVFSGLFVSMARAGEESGSLAEALEVVALQMERTEELTKKVRGAMIYPAIVLIAIIIVAVLMLMYVVPTLTKTFTELGVAIPLTTQIIVALSDFMAANVLLVFIGLVAFFIGLVAFVRSRVGSTLVIRVALHLPVIGELVRETYAARTARTLSSLLSAGVPVLRALAITKDTVRAEAFAAVIAEAETRVKKGGALSAAFAEHAKLYTVLMSDMLAVGEETGKVGEMLKQVAEFYETDVAERTKDLSTIIEPVLMLFIGTVVGIFAVSMIAPIYSLSSAIAG
ncbi:MAG: type II secretion system F family protein [bacterium]|nr:type II secretion system F family protein [bacterium]